MSPCQKMHKLFLLVQDSAGGSERLQSRGRPKPAPTQRGFRHHVRRPPRLGVTTENRSLPLRGDEGYPVLLLCPFQPAHRNSRGPTTLGLPLPSPSLRLQPRYQQTVACPTGECQRPPRRDGHHRGPRGEGEGDCWKVEGSARCLTLHLTPCFLISKMEPTLEDTSPGLCAGLRRHRARSAEKHLRRDQENRVLCHQGKLRGARGEGSVAQEGSGGEGGGRGRGDLERDPDQTRRVQGCACRVLRRPALPDGQPTEGALPPPSPPLHRTGSARTDSQGTHG